MKLFIFAMAMLISQSAMSNDCKNGFVRLTFDDGPNPYHTLNVLDVLQRYNSKATFFVIGQNVSKYPEIVKRIFVDGHRIGNHSWDHPHLTKLSHSEIENQFKKTNDAVKAITGFQPLEWRPPYEDWNNSIHQEAQKNGMSIALWNYETDPSDWKEFSVEKITEIVLSNVKPGSIILLHDSYEHTVKALPSILEGLASMQLCAR